MNFMTEEDHISKSLDKDILALFKRHVQAVWRPIRVTQEAHDQRVADLEELARNLGDRITQLERLERESIDREHRQVVARLKESLSRKLCAPA